MRLLTTIFFIFSFMLVQVVHAASVQVAGGTIINNSSKLGNPVRFTWPWRPSFNADYVGPSTGNVGKFFIMGDIESAQFGQFVINPPNLVSQQYQCVFDAGFKPDGTSFISLNSSKELNCEVAHNTTDDSYTITITDVVSKN